MAAGTEVVVPSEGDVVDEAMGAVVEVSVAVVVTGSDEGMDPTWSGVVVHPAASTAMSVRIERFTGAA